MSYKEFVLRILTIIAIGVVCLLLWQLRNIIMIAYLAAIVAVSLSIPVEKLQRLGMKRGYAIATTLITVVLFLILFIAWILPVLVVQMADLFSELPNAFTDAVEAYGDWREEQSQTIRDVLPRPDADEIRQKLGLEEGEQVVSVQDVTDFALPLLRGAGNIILGVVGNLAIVIIVSVFLLVAPRDYIYGALMLVPQDYQKRAFEVMMELRRALTAWLSALSLSISVTTFLVWLILGIILGVPNALALGVIAGLASIIPNIGVLIPIIPISIFTLADEPSRLPIVLIAYILIQQTEGNLITPSIVKQQLNIPAAAVFIFQLIAGSLFGFFGVLLAVPLLATVITLVRELYVYDVLGMRGVRVELQTSEDGELRLIKSKADVG